MQAKPLLIFDGDCGFCTTTANYIVKHSKTAIEIKPWQYVDFTNLPVTSEQCADQVYFLIDGVPYGGHEAFAMILRSQRNVSLKAFGSILMLKALRFITTPAYRLTAKYRQKLPGGTPACKLPK
jgi:predicted DCC family thiol-disulfide oxidoreductase YuxK